MVEIGTSWIFLVSLMWQLTYLLYSLFPPSFRGSVPLAISKVLYRSIPKVISRPRDLEKNTTLATNSKTQSVHPMEKVCNHFTLFTFSPERAHLYVTDWTIRYSVHGSGLNSIREQGVLKLRFGWSSYKREWRHGRQKKDLMEQCRDLNRWKGTQISRSDVRGFESQHQQGCVPRSIRQEAPLSGSFFTIIVFFLSLKIVRVGAN